MAQSGFPGNEDAADAINNHSGNNGHAASQSVAVESTLDIGTVGTTPNDPASFVDFVY
jgi:hypothetical protein